VCLPTWTVTVLQSGRDVLCAHSRPLHEGSPGAEVEASLSPGLASTHAHLLLWIGHHGVLLWPVQQNENTGLDGFQSVLPQPQNAIFNSA
jgi:hypothetical protein